LAPEPALNWQLARSTVAPLSAQRPVAGSTAHYIKCPFSLAITDLRILIIKFTTF